VITASINLAATVSSFIHLAYGTKVSCLVTTPRALISGQISITQIKSNPLLCPRCLRASLAASYDLPCRAESGAANQLHLSAALLTAASFSALKVRGLDRSIESRFRIGLISGHPRRMAPEFALSARSERESHGWEPSLFASSSPHRAKI